MPRQVRDDDDDDDDDGDDGVMTHHRSAEASADERVVSVLRWLLSQMMGSGV